ncbi:MAG: hypothetical protein OXH22_01715 [Chloroflexi bacterium]|nr:hypothetical protein [Chloroflexota bacterium]
MAGDMGSTDRSARLGGVFLLLTALVTAVMVYARVASDADQRTLAESLLVISENREMYGLFGVSRLLSGVTLILGGWFLLRTWIIRDRWATPWVPYLFVGSGACTVVSGACALLIVIQADAAGTGSVAGIAAADNLRWIIGKVGFSAAGLALMIAARFQWGVGGTLRKIAPGSALLGFAMQFIWLDSATVAHPIIGSLFFIWLLAIGAMLATGQVEKHFVKRYGAGMPASGASERQ